MEHKPAQHDKGFDRLLAVPLAVYLGIIVILVAGVFVTVTREAAAKAFTDSAVWYAVYLSLFSSLVSTALAVAFAIPSGYVLSRKRFPGMAIADTVLDLPIVLPPLVMGLCVLLFFRTAVGKFIDRNLLEIVFTWRGIIFVQFVVGCAYAIRVMKAGFDALDRKYEDVAMTLGANRWQTFTKVSIPIIRPSLVAAAVISWARIFGLFGPVLLVAGTMRHKTEIMPTSVYLEMSIGRIEVALVIGAMMILISVAMLLALKKFGGEGRLWQ